MRRVFRKERRQRARLLASQARKAKRRIGKRPTRQQWWADFRKLFAEIKRREE